MVDLVHMGDNARFRGLKVLLVEDEVLISFLVEDMLTELGCAAVWHAKGVKEALAILREKRPDCAVLDVNLAGEFVYPLAAQLDTAKIPFVFATGYGREGIQPPWGRKPVVQKPYDTHALASALSSVLVHP